jgi:DNA repair exonuclease SbcCD ATPase subunit
MEYASNVQRRSDLLHSMDESTLIITAIHQSNCSQDTVLSDLQVSEAMLTSEYALLVGELSQATAYIEQLKSVHEQLISCQVDATLTNDPMQQPLLDQKNSSSSSSIPCDDRMHLMRDVETLYKRAVNSKESMLTRKQRLIENIGSSYSRNAQWKQDSDRLDHEIGRVRGQRDQLELSFSTCNLSLDEACRNVQLKVSVDCTPQYTAVILTCISNQMNHLEVLLEHLEEEETELNEVLQKYCSQELLLREELEAIQEEFNGTAPKSSARTISGPATWGRQHITVKVW